jgi:hypothetical protein
MDGEVRGSPSLRHLESVEDVSIVPSCQALQLLAGIILGAPRPTGLKRISRVMWRGRRYCNGLYHRCFGHLLITEKKRLTHSSGGTKHSEQDERL